MAVMIGNARISEHGTVNGTKGDQTGREVMQQTWSSGGFWQYVIRPKSETAAKKIAKAMIEACSNNNIGYSQADRLSLYKAAKANGWKISRVGKCNCDCSSLVAVCCMAAGIEVSPMMYTGNELAVLKATGKFTIYTGTHYTKASNLLRTGDILLRAGHTAIVTDGAVGFNDDAKAAPSTSSLNKTVKWTGKVTADTLNVRTWAGKEYPNIKTTPTIKKGKEVGVCDTVKSSKGSNWYYIKIGKVHGFVSAKYIKKI